MGFFKKIGNALKKTREAIARKIDALLSHGEIDDDFFDELTDILISCDIGVRTSMDIVDNLRIVARKFTYSSSFSNPINPNNSYNSRILNVKFFYT